MDGSLSADAVLLEIATMGSSLLCACDPCGLVRGASADRLWFSSSSLGSPSGVAFILTCVFPDGARMRLRGKSALDAVTLTGLEVLVGGTWRAVPFVRSGDLPGGLPSLSALPACLRLRFRAAPSVPGSFRRRGLPWSQSSFDHAVAPLLGCVGGFRSPREFGKSFGGVSLQFVLSPDGRPHGALVSGFRYADGARVVASREVSLSGAMPGRVVVDCRRGDVRLSCDCSGLDGAPPSFDAVSEVASLLSGLDGRPSERRKRQSLRSLRG